MTPERLAELETKAKHPEWKFAAPKATILDLITHIRDLEAQVRQLESAYYAQRLALAKLSVAAQQGINEGEAIRATATPPSPEVGA